MSVPEFFLIYALPRSRTKWLARFLSFGECLCHHDLSLRVADIGAALKATDARIVGNSDSGMLLNPVAPVMGKILCVIRPLGEVMDSLAACGLTPRSHHARAMAAEFMERATADLHALAARTRSVKYRDLDSEIECITEYLTGQRPAQSRVMRYRRWIINKIPHESLRFVEQHGH